MKWLSVGIEDHSWDMFSVMARRDGRTVEETLGVLLAALVDYVEDKLWEEAQGPEPEREEKESPPMELNLTRKPTYH